MLSRAKPVTGAKAAAALADPLSQRMILAFAGRPRSLAEVARAHGFDIKRLHHHVGRFCRLGLLEVAEVRPRAGRPVKYYRTVAEAYFVPHAAAPELATEALARDLRAGLGLAARRPGKGFVFYADDEGRACAEPARGDGALEAVEMWRAVSLAPADLAAFQADLQALFARYALRAGPGAKPYLMHAALAPQPNAEPEPEPEPEAAAPLPAFTASARIKIA